MIFYVKSRPDREALLHVFRRVYGWEPIIKTLSVQHRELQDAVESIEEDDLVVVLLGRSECRWVEQEWPTKKVVCFWREKVRNGRTRDLVELVERAKSAFIYDVSWEGTYIMGKGGLLARKEPGGDVYFVPEEWPYKQTLSEIMGRDVGTPLIHLFRGTEILYGGPHVIGTVPRGGGRVVDHGGEAVYVEKDGLIRKNREALEAKVEVTLKKMKEVLEGFEDVLVPLSGGKDSAVVALLLKEADIDFIPVFVDTGGEYKETLSYIEELEKYVGPIERVEAPVARKYKELGDSYLQQRHCTRDKISALYAFASRFDNPILVNGDRVAESKARSFRPYLRKDRFWVFSPIQLWSYLNEQMYFWSRGVPMNSLYERGFYRVGCSFCPFTDVIERLSLLR